MAQQTREMALILSTPVEELVPKLIAWNNEQLLEQTKAALVEYKGRTYDDDSIVEAKGDRATLNKFAQALDNERKRIKKVYTAPLDKFTAEVNEVIATVNAVSTEIDKQVKSFEERKAAEKFANVKAYFAEVLPESLAEFIPYEKIHQKEWLNTSKSMTAVQKEINAVVDKIVQEIATIETLKSDDEVELKALYFQTLNLSATLMENERKKAEKQRIMDAMAAENKTPVKVEKTAPAPIPDVEEKTYAIAFKVTGTAAELNALSRFLKDNNYNYEKI